MRNASVPRLAIVDPDPTNCLLLREIGLASGWSVTGWADSVAEGLALVARVRPDCLITDFHYEGAQTGLDLIARAKRIAPNLFTVILTGWNINDVATRVAGTPPDRILRKPVPPHFIMNMLDAITDKVPSIRINAV